MKAKVRFWVGVGLIWILATFFDRLWWHNYNSIPAWDQADYLNSALDHGRALGILPGGQWQGFKELLDLSPKIPPLASIVNGVVIAFAGDAPAQAAWSLSLWHGLLLVSVAGWGWHLRNERLGLLSAAFVAITPALLQLRSDYVLEMSLVSVITLALWQLNCWFDSHQNHSWRQAIIAAFTCTAAVLVKQSALLILLPALGWATIRAISHTRKSQWQLMVGVSVVIVGVWPWLSHNWITTLSGTNRAVIESASKEGDPSLLTLENWIWYPRLLVDQLGPILLFVGLTGGILWILMEFQSNTNDQRNSGYIDNQEGWKWLIFLVIAGWLFTSISPNKDERYITPLLPLMLLLLARGWIQWGILIDRIWPNQSRLQVFLALLTGLGASLSTAMESQVNLLNKGNQGPLEDIVKEAGGADPLAVKNTIIVVPSTPDLNQHNVSYFGRRNGGNLIGRQLGNNRSDIGPVIAQAKLVILAEGSPGSVRKAATALDQAIRTSGVFIEIGRFPRNNGNSYSLWQRRNVAPKVKSFAKKFPNLAKGLADGPQGLKRVFDEVATQHMLDGHFTYRTQVREDSLKKLERNPKDTEALWSLALLETLANRPDKASNHFSSLQELLPDNPWPSAYLSFVSLADLNPWQAASIAENAKSKYQSSVIIGLADISKVLGGAVWHLPAATRSIPKALDEVNEALAKPQSDINTHAQDSN